MVKCIIYNENVCCVFEKGIDIFCEVVVVILGFKGCNVVFEKKFGVFQIINDGVIIVKEIEFEDYIENIGVVLICQVVFKINDVVGDGIIIVIVLVYVMVKVGLCNVVVGVNVIILKKGIDKVFDFLVSKIKEMVKFIVDSNVIVQVGIIFVGNDEEVGKMIVDVMDKVGKEGVIFFEEGKFMEIEFEVIEGMCFDKGYIFFYFVIDIEWMEVVFDEFYIFFIDKKIGLVQDLVFVLE